MGTERRLEVRPALMAAAAQGIDEAGLALHRQVVAFTGALAALGRPWGDDELGRAFFEGEDGAPGFRTARDASLESLAGRVLALRGHAAGVTRMAELYETAEAAGAGRAVPPAGRGARPPGGAASPAPLDVVGPAGGALAHDGPPPPWGAWLLRLLEELVVGCSWPAGDARRLEQLAIAFEDMAEAADQVGDAAADHAREIFKNNAGAGIDGFARSFFGMARERDPADLCRAVAAHCRAMATGIEAVKTQFRRSLLFLAVLWATARAFALLPAGATAHLLAMSRTAVVGLALRRLILDVRVRAALAGAVYDGGLGYIAQDAQRDHGLRQDIDWTSVALSAAFSSAAGATMGAAYLRLGRAAAGGNDVAGYFTGHLSGRLAVNTALGFAFNAGGEALMNGGDVDWGRALLMAGGAAVNGEVLNAFGVNGPALDLLAVEGGAHPAGPATGPGPSPRSATLTSVADGADGADGADVGGGGGGDLYAHPGQGARQGADAAPAAPGAAGVPGRDPAHPAYAAQPGTRRAQAFQGQASEERAFQGQAFQDRAFQDRTFQDRVLQGQAFQDRAFQDRAFLDRALQDQGRSAGGAGSREPGAQATHPPLASRAPAEHAHERGGGGAHERGGGSAHEQAAGGAGERAARGADDRAAGGAHERGAGGGAAARGDVGAAQGSAPGRAGTSSPGVSHDGARAEAPSPADSRDRAGAPPRPAADPGPATHPGPDAARGPAAGAPSPAAVHTVTAAAHTAASHTAASHTAASAADATPVAAGARADGGTIAAGGTAAADGTPASDRAGLPGGGHDPYPRYGRDGSGGAEGPGHDGGDGEVRPDPDGPRIDLSLLHPVAALEFSAAVRQVAAEYPALHRDLRHLRADDFSADPRLAGLRLDAYAVTTGEGRGLYFDANVLNGRPASEAASWEEAGGWTVPGGGSIAGVVRHEFGHYAAERIMRDPAVRAEVGDVVSRELGFPYDLTRPHDPVTRTAVESRLSTLGMDNPHDMIAEAFAEDAPGARPRPLARAIGEVIRRHYGGERDLSPVGDRPADPVDVSRSDRSLGAREEVHARTSRPEHPAAAGARRLMEQSRFAGRVDDWDGVRATRREGRDLIHAHRLHQGVEWRRFRDGADPETVGWVAGILMGAPFNIPSERLFAAREPDPGPVADRPGGGEPAPRTGRPKLVYVKETTDDPSGGGEDRPDTPQNNPGMLQDTQGRTVERQVAKIWQDIKGPLQQAADDAWAKGKERLRKENPELHAADPHLVGDAATLVGTYAHTHLNQWIIDNGDKLVDPEKGYRLRGEVSYDRKGREVHDTRDGQGTMLFGRRRDTIRPDIVLERTVTVEDNKGRVVAHNWDVVLVIDLKTGKAPIAAEWEGKVYERLNPVFASKELRPAERTIEAIAKATAEARREREIEQARRRREARGH
ncbi:WXG100-like domain-containing protein [Nonomuraea muscovyensis]